MKKGIIFAALLAVAGSASAQSRIDQMISPAFHPVTFEDPRSQSEARAIYAYHAIEDDFITEGGDVQIYALQLRYAINDRLAIIATKDGYVDFNPNATLPKDSGWADISAGVKYAFYKDDTAGQIASAQLRYIAPTGDEEVLQGNGDGVIHPSVSSAIALSERTTLTTGTGLRIPVDNDDSLFWDLDAQVDYRIDLCSWSLYPLLGLSLVHVADGGNRLPLTSEGQDFFNFGSSDAGGESIVLGAAGFRARVADDVDFGASYQFPLDETDGTQVVDHRWTFDTIVRF
jgi:hypothetical protein